jgi:Domain of unknown function (DUF4190)
MTTDLKGKRISGLTIAGFCTAWFIGPLGIALSAFALSEINNNQDTLRGKGFAKWGIGIGILSTVATVLMMLAANGDADLRRANGRSDRALQDYNRKNGR